MLIADPKKTLQEICSFLEEKYEDNLLNYHQIPKYYYSSTIEIPQGYEGEDKHLFLRNWQINQPLFKNTTRWKTEMGQSEKEIFKKYAQAFLKELSYVNNILW